MPNRCFPTAFIYNRLVAGSFSLWFSSYKCFSIFVPFCCHFIKLKTPSLDQRASGYYVSNVIGTQSLGTLKASENDWIHRPSFPREVMHISLSLNTICRNAFTAVPHFFGKKYTRLWGEMLSRFSSQNPNCV